MRRLMLLVVALFALATPAFAHVEVSPETASKGGSATFTFNVEDERDRANEITVEFYLPAGLAQDNVRPSGPAGWDVVFTVSPGSVRFTHNAPGPQGDQSFTLAVDHLPDTSDLVFKTVVGYDNGDFDRWIDVPGGGSDLPHPAAIVRLNGGATATTMRSTTITVQRPDRGTNRGLIAGVIFAAVVVVGGLIAYARRGPRRTS